MINFEIKNRFTGNASFTSEIDADESMALSVKIGLAVKWAIKFDADLRGANLSDADLRGADLRDANLRDANLRDANLRGANLSDANFGDANLSDANLRSFKADLWMTLTENKSEVRGLIDSMKNGKINGSVYLGECACLKGTLANVKGISVNEYEKDVSQPAEQWFLMIQKGDKPEDKTGGGFALKTALDWTLEWCDLNDIPTPIEGGVPVGTVTP